MIQRGLSPVIPLFPEVQAPISQRKIHQINAPARIRSRALAEVTLVNRVAETAVRRSLSFSEYSDYYEHRAGTRIDGTVSDAAPTVLDWEIGG